MFKFVYKGGIFDKTQSVARAALAHFNKWGVFQASPDSVYYGGISLDQTELITAAKTLTSFESGKNILYAALASQVVTMPLASKGKMRFVISIHALVTSGAGTRINPATGDKFVGCGLTGTANQYLLNAAAADVLGDFVELISDGDTTWHIVRKAGAWTVNT
jgi:hypothetical protein